ncbi:hypothetical protein [Streptomyces sp. PD-S100-1]
MIRLLVLRARLWFRRLLGLQDVRTGRLRAEIARAEARRSA